MDYHISKKSYDGRWRNPKTRVIDRTPQPMFRKVQSNAPTNDKILLWYDEVEALKLKYIDGLHIVEAAECMKISKSLCATIINKALSKLVRWIVYGTHIEIQKDKVVDDFFYEPVL